MFNTRRKTVFVFLLYICCEEEMCLQSNSFQPQEENCLFWLCWAGNCESKWHHCRNENTSNVSVSKREKVKKHGTGQPFPTPFFALFSIFSWQLTLFAPAYLSMSSMMMTRMRRNDAQKKIFFEVPLVSAAPLISFPLYLESVSLLDWLFLVFCLFVCLDALQVSCNSVFLE